MNTGQDHRHTPPPERPPETGQNHIDRARAALQKLQRNQEENAEPTQGELVKRYKPFLVEGILGQVPITKLMDSLTSLGEPIKIEGFRAALRQELGTVKAIRQQKRPEPPRIDEPKRMSSFIHPAHRGEG